MTREQVEHAIRAVCDLTKDDAVIIVGSQSILGAFPDASPLLRQSMEIEVSPKDRHEQAHMIESLGEDSLFHRTHHYYIDPVRPKDIQLPPGWERRLVPAYGPGTNGKTGWCLEPHDLACAKLAAFREKDLNFVRELIAGDYVRAHVVVERLHTMSIESARQERCVKWVQLTADSLRT